MAGSRVLSSSSEMAGGAGSRSTGALRRSRIGQRRMEREREHRLKRRRRRKFGTGAQKSTIVDDTNSYAGVLAKWEEDEKEEAYSSGGSRPFSGFEQRLITPESRSGALL